MELKEIKWAPIVCLILALVAVAVLYFKGGDPMDHLKIVAGYTLLLLVFFYGLMVLIAIARNEINLKYLVSDNDTGRASMARFQLLIFTFVIALSLFMIIVSNSSNGNKKLEFPAIPNQVLTLLGISATTYAVGKHIQASGGSDGDAGGSEGDSAADNQKADEKPPEKKTP
jgi:hypothetical protein